MVAALARLEFLARGRKQGGINGRHASPNRGASVVFAQHRPYVAGDNIRDMDWRAYGRVDRYYIKQYTEETNLRATLLVDCSGSMNYRGERAAEVNGVRLSKFEYARHFAAAVAWLMVKQRDAAGLVTFDDRVRTMVRAGARPDQARLILEALGRATPGGDTRLAEVLHEVAERVPPRGVVMLFSDCFEPAEAVINAFHHFKHRQHELILFHVMADEELTFPFKDSREFRDLESSGARLKVDPRAIRAAYLAKVKEHTQKLERACGQMKADYVPLNTKHPCARAFTEWLEGRGRRVR